MVPEAHTDPHSIYGDLANEYEIIGGDDLQVTSQLAALGFHPDDITHVVLSHSHWDHAGGIRLSPVRRAMSARASCGSGFGPTL